ncbi:Polycystic kidney disease protein 1-like 2, partial [Frankliniella fusca]
MAVCLARRCERNCGTGMGVLHSERVSLRARCSAPCPRLSWSLSPAPAGPAALPLGSRGRRLVIAPHTLVEHAVYTVHLRVGVGETWVNASSLILSMIPKPNHTCSSRGYGVQTTIRCQDNEDASSRWTAYTLYKFFQRSSKGGRVLIGYTFTGIGVALVFLNAPVEIVATMLWGAEWSMNLTVAGGRPSSLNLSTTISKAVQRYQKGNEMVATVMIASSLVVLLERGETPDQRDLSNAAAACNEYMSSTPHPALWWQYAEMTLILAELGVSGMGTFLDDLSQHMGALLVKVSEQLVQLAQHREPPAISTQDVEDRFRKITKVITYMAVDANSDMAKKIRNLSVSEDELDPDYLLYTDLLPGHLDRERKFRAGARGAIKTLYNLIRATQWRLLPGLPPAQVDVDSSAVGLGRITVWSQVDSMVGLAERPNATLPEHCDFHVDAEKGRELDLHADAFALTVAFIKGSLSWFEPVPADMYANTPSSALVDLQVFDDGPAGEAPTVAEVVGVTLPTPAAVAADEARVQGQLRAAPGAQWTDHVVVYHLHAYDGTGAVQVTFPAGTRVGARNGSGADDQMEMIVVLQEKWPKTRDFFSPRAVTVSQASRHDLVVGVAVRNRLSSFVHLGLAFSNATLERAAARGEAEITLDYTFIPLNLACKSWSDSRYRWVTGEHREVWQLSSPRALSCALHHLSLFSGLVLLPPHFVHPLRDAALFATLDRNWLVFVYVMVWLFVWLVWLPFAIRRDRADRKEWRVVVLDDISPDADYPYLVSVFSGNLAQGQTTAYVGLRICGDKQDSGAHMLSHSRRPLSRTYDDWFLLYTPGPLGELMSLELWTDCAGMRPYWYCEKVLVEELATGRVWTFPAYCWLSLEHGSRRACVTLPPAPLLWKHRFNSLLKATARGDHTWLSVLF